MLSPSQIFLISSTYCTVEQSIQSEIENMTKLEFHCLLSEVCPEVNHFIWVKFKKELGDPICSNG